MKLSNLHIVGDSNGPVDIDIKDGRIATIANHKDNVRDSIPFENALVFLFGFQGNSVFKNEV